MSKYKELTRYHLAHCGPDKYQPAFERTLASENRELYNCNLLDALSLNSAGTAL